jgi:hypothetical protein
MNSSLEFVIAGLDPAILLASKKMDHPNSGLPEFGTLSAQVGYTDLRWSSPRVTIRAS